MNAIRNLPKGLHSATRYVAAWPDTQENRNYDKSYTDLYGDHPTNWSWEASIAIDYLIEAMKVTGGTDNKKLAEAMRGKTSPSFMGVGRRQLCNYKRERSNHNKLFYWLGNNNS